jgi:hypothetical protein
LVSESIPLGLPEGKDQLVGYGKQLKMIFSPSTDDIYKSGGFKECIFDIFLILGLASFLEHHIIIDYAWCNELITLFQRT